MRDSLVFYRSFYEAIKKLPKSLKLSAYDAIVAYALDEELLEVKGAANAVFTMAVPQVDANNKKFKDGIKGGRPSKNNNLRLSHEEPNGNENENLNVNEKEKVNGNGNGAHAPKDSRILRPLALTTEGR
ncbi:MAG: DUF6291 domain-containing protein [Defluviitaleaceae bacterium]|nr:DUF6291 domain-containing protein [Defluviitaleaceae bacterium]